VQCLPCHFFKLLNYENLSTLRTNFFWFNIIAIDHTYFRQFHPNMFRFILVVILLLGFLATPTSAQVFNCTNALVDCSAHGVCADAHLCVCNDGFLTFQNEPNVQCNYQQTKVLGPFLAQLFVGWFSGAGCFMLHEIGLGVAQVLVFWILPLLLLFINEVIDEEDEFKIPVIMMWSWILVVAALEVTSLAMMGSFQFTDKNNVSMVAWV